MGDLNIHRKSSLEARTAFIRHVLNDIKALEYMLSNNLIESGITRIGAEQEFCLVNNNWRPSKVSPEILKEINDPHFTTELAIYSLEVNLDPEPLGGKCFKVIEKNLRDYLQKASDVAEKHNNKILLTGILPTLSKNHLEYEFMTPLPRYWALDEMIKELRTSDFVLHIRGVDELSIAHDSILFEACNTSFQMHLQIDPDDFISSYNWAQAISGPVLAISTNSPLFLGRELWRETRIALFQQSIDTRSYSRALNEREPRVKFGNNWEEGTIADIYKNEVAEHPIILTKEIEADSLEMVEEGTIPKLAALGLHNGTIYRWNRACYGANQNKAHVRIECRYLPCGPSIVDQISNFAFWVGLMRGRPKYFNDMPSVMDFREAKSNFVKAARTGKESLLYWRNNHDSVGNIVQKDLLPIAYEGLTASGVEKEDIEYFLGNIEKRVSGRTGAHWAVVNYRKLKKKIKPDDALVLIAKCMYENQQKNTPISEWPLIEDPKEVHLKSASLIGHIMSTQLFTINENDSADLATEMMLWKDIHHLPVESKMGVLKGILSWKHLESYKKDTAKNKSLLVSDIMEKEVITVEPTTEIHEAIKLMKSKSIGCLPVVQDNHLVGIVTINDLTMFNDGESV